MLSLLCILIFVDCGMLGVKYWKKNCILHRWLSRSRKTSEHAVSGSSEEISQELYIRAKGPDVARSWFHFGDDRGQSQWALLQPPATLLSIPEACLIRFTGVWRLSQETGGGDAAGTGRQSIPGRTPHYTHLKLRLQSEGMLVFLGSPERTRWCGEETTS